MLRVLISAVLFAALIGSVNADPRSVYEPPPKQQADKPESRQHPAVTPSEASEAAPQREQGKQHFGQRLWDFTLTDVLLAIFTGVLVCVGVKQWRVLKDSVAIADKAADAAKIAADTAINAARPVLLPRIVSAEAPINIRNSPDAEPKISFAFENHGTGVAIITKVICDIIICGEPLPDSRQFVSPRDDKRRIVVPGSHRLDIEEDRKSLSNYKARISKELGQDNRTAVFTPVPQTKFLYLIGTVYYEDLFGFEYEGGFALMVKGDGQQHGIRGGSAYNYYKYWKKNEARET